MQAEFTRESGMTLFELLVVVAIAGFVAIISVSAVLPYYQREQLRGAVRNVQMSLQVDRMEAVKRNRPCRLVLDTLGKSIQVWDGMGTDVTDDDVLLHSVELTSTIEFLHPGGDVPVTFKSLGDAIYEVVFNADGTVGVGDGQAVLYGGGMFQRLNLQVAGGVRLTRWNGSGWEY